MALVVLVLLAGVIVGALAAEGNNGTGTPGGNRQANGAGSHGARGSRTTRPKTTRPVPPPGVTARLLAWRLPVPVSRTVVLAGPGTSLVVAGGLTRSGASGNGAFLLSTTSGAIHLVAGLVTAVHDASGAILGGRDVIFGGEGTAASSMVQAFNAPSGAAVPASSVPLATGTAALPQPRTGSSAVAIGATSYVIGGSDGTAADREVLATIDGNTFRAVAALPVPVEYPAVAALGGYIYVFGGRTVPVHPARAGTAVAPARAGTPVADIQRIDPHTGRGTVVGHLAVALEGASAATLDGHIYLAGGRTATSVQGTIWAYVPATASMVVAGHLRLPVSNSGIAVMGSSAWLVGGESGGRPVASVQTFSPLRAQPAGPSRGPGTSGPSTTRGDKLTPLAGAAAYESFSTSTG